LKKAYKNKKNPDICNCWLSNNKRLCQKHVQPKSQGGKSKYRKGKYSGSIALRSLPKTQRTSWFMNSIPDRTTGKSNFT